MANISPYHDIRGIPIYDGDLIRAKHYRHCLRREQMWLYFQVRAIPLESGDVRWYVRHWGDDNPEGRQCQLVDVGPCEILQERGLHRDPAGNIQTFNQRPRTKGNPKP